ncbi:MAG: DUF393 domain-containing protein [Cytophagaceae bacterium]|jgi:predicted DCC family thiol-disulfide oxidoreductase YuxK|nr:DUF393 domain-containing protein [Cytophagaceae bacterium]
MATLNDHTLLYDEDCPLCQGYSAAFIKAGLLDKDGRKPFHTMGAWKNYIDPIRARHEIALIERSTGRVYYGTTGLVKILASRWSWMGACFRLAWVRSLVNLVYAFISYNRKVIMPFRNDYSRSACAPDYHAGYRIAYLLFSGFLTAALLQWAGTFLPWYGSLVPPSAEWWIVPSHWIFQWLILWPANKEEAVTYAGQLQTASLIAAILLLPIAMISAWVPWLGYLGFGLVLAFLFFHYKRRMQVLHFPKRMTYAWLAYRILLLVVLMEIAR